MPYRFSIEPDRNLIRESFSGTVTAEELMRLSREEWADPRFRRGINVISDLRDAHLDITFEQMVQYAAFVEQGQGVGRQALIVDTDLAFGLARMFESLTEGKGAAWTALKIFNDPEAAERWVGGGTAC